MKYCLSLDLGVGSIGYAVTELNDSGDPIRIEKFNSLKFTSGRESKTQASLAKERREKRASRRMRDRFLRRQKKLLNYLESLNLMPKCPLQRHQVLNTNHPGIRDKNPYFLRDRAAREPLHPFELGRFFHILSSKRGYQSNRKSADEADEKKLLDLMSDLRQKLKSYKTLGTYFAHLQAQGKPVVDSRKVEKGKIDYRMGLQVERQMVKDEFDFVQAVQAPHFALSEQDWQSIREIIFYQRPLKPVERGRCQIYGPSLSGQMSEEHQWALRAYKADPRAQKFRAWQDINNLKVTLLSQPESRHLTLEERSAVWRHLSLNKNLSFSSLRKKVLKLPPGTLFNLEEGGKKELLGMSTDCILGHPDVFGQQWSELETHDKTAIVEIIQGQSDMDKALESLIAFGFNENQATKALKKPLEIGKSKKSLEIGTSAFCPKALDQLVEVMTLEPVSDLRYPSSTEAEIKIRSCDEGDESCALKVNFLEYYAKMIPGVGLHHAHRTDCDEKLYGVISNPSVHIGLNQLRKLVNAVIKNYGRPTQVAIELARDLKLPLSKKNELRKIQKKNETLKDEFYQEVEAAGLVATKKDFKKYKLWLELADNPMERRCVYSGQVISLSRLLSPEVNIEHILPKSWSLDDSMANLTVTTRDSNKLKGAMTPYEFFKKFDPQGLAPMIARSSKLPRNKRWRFTSEAKEKFKGDNEQWLSSLLNDTKYLSKVAKRYMSFICDDVRVSPGKLTSKARYQWLGDVFEKDREVSYVHHGIDALIVGLISRKTLQQASLLASGEDESQRLGFKLPCPMDKATLHSQVKDILEHCATWHKLEHGAEGRLHKDTCIARGSKKYNHESNVMIKHQQGDIVHLNKYEHGGIHAITFWTLQGQVMACPVYRHQVFQSQPRPHPAAKLLIKVHKGDTVSMRVSDDKRELFVIKKITPSGNNMTFLSINSASDKDRFTKSFSSLLEMGIKKVSVNILGHVCQNE